MIILLTLLFFTVALLFYKQIRNFFIPLFIITIGISFATYFLELDIFNPVYDGFISTALFFNVMFATAFKTKSIMSKRLRYVRKEYSIFAFVLIVPHAIIYLIETLQGVLTFDFSGIITFLIMIPLTVTSFYLIRKRINNKVWVAIHQFAYPAYILLFIHLILLGSGTNALYYLIIFSSYITLKIYNHFLVKESIFYKTIVSTIFTTLVFVFVLNNSSIDLFKTSDVVALNEVVLEDGTFEGSSYGYEDHITIVNVTIVDGAISSIDIIEDGSSEPRRIDYSAAAIWAANEIVSTQSLDIDNYAGATHTVEGIIEAVEDAIN
jgi:DMSO/TMAO reductase YedYZ heme-binding membrane subunit/uncharacterized protein with FMN-binding domain